jgi:hypothetical protein
MPGQRRKTARLARKPPKPAKRANGVLKGKAGPLAKLPLDAYGYRKGSLKSQAAGMYSSKHGATLAEVKDALGSVQLNVLSDLREKGYKIEREKERGPDGRQTTRYYVK